MQPKVGVLAEHGTQHASTKGGLRGMRIRGCPASDAAVHNRRVRAWTCPQTPLAVSDVRF